MSEINFMEVLTRLRPDASWVPGETYEDIVWLDAEQSKPSLEECEEYWLTLEPRLVHEEILTSRQAAYREQSDPVYFQMQRGEASEQDWLDSVASVREQYPYPN